MSISWEHSIRYLKVIEKKHEGFFIANKLKLLDCIQIAGTRSVKVNIINQELPFEIKQDIEEMFPLDHSKQTGNL